MYGLYRPPAGNKKKIAINRGSTVFLFISDVTSDVTSFGFQCLQLKHELGDRIISIAELLGHNLTNVLAKNFGS